MKHLLVLIGLMAALIVLTASSLTSSMSDFVFEGESNPVPFVEEGSQ